MSRLGPTLVVVALLAATAISFGVSERLKLEQSPIQSTRVDRLFSPTCTACRPEARGAEIRFRLRTADHITVDIVDRDGTAIREQLVSARLRPGALRFVWDGRDGTGRVVADGVYHVRVTLDEESRTLEFPGGITVDTKAPTIDSIAVHPRVISPDGDRRSDRATIEYRFGEQAYAVLYVDDKRENRSFRKRPAGRLQWYGIGEGVGTHRLALAAQDLAGNMSPSTRAFPVRIRFVELARHRFRPTPGGRLRVRVSTDATRLTWRLGTRVRVVAGERPIRSFIAPAPGAPGRYLLTVRVGNHLDRAVVIVRR